ncbi:sulfurtransferase TusA family protein [Thiolapillus sp.]
MQSTDIPTETLDARGLNCPLPILKTRKAIGKLHKGEVLEVKSTDPGSIKDLDAFCRQTGNEMLQSRDDNGEFVFLLRKV